MDCGILNTVTTSSILFTQGEQDMKRKTADEYPQELLDLFHEYQHGYIDRRSFLGGIGKFAVGGLTAATIFESLTPNYAWRKPCPRTTKTCV